jgi:uncharacterized glyoxalase superfamily protein PhnB
MTTPPGWHTVTPRIFTDDPQGLVDFITRVFDAEGEFQETRPTELRIGDSMLMVSGTEARAATAACLYVYVRDVDWVYARALAAGARSIETPMVMPYGDRRAMVEDAWGNTWQIATYLSR